MSLRITSSMRWLNIEIATLRCPAYIGAEPTERATWLSLLGYCADQENGGRIAECKRWKDRQWQQVCGITQTEAHAVSKLWTWDGDDIVVSFYPLASEAIMQAKREAGRRGGMASRKNAKKAQPQAPLGAQLQAVLEGNEKEGNEKESNDVGELELGLAASEPSRPTSAKKSSAKKSTSKPKQIDEAMLVELINDPAYSGIDVRREAAKMARWYATHGKAATPRKLVAWLNRCEVPTNGDAQAVSKSAAPLRPYEAKMKAEAIRKRIERISADYGNKVRSEESFGWVLKPEAKAEIAGLRAKLKELDAILVQ
jgi:hypothetical protein